MRRGLRLIALLAALVLALVPGRLAQAVEERAVQMTYDSPTNTLDIDGYTAPMDHDDGEKVNIFPNFVELMPGDEREQDVALTVRGNTGQVRVYIVAEMPEETYEAMGLLRLAATLDGTLVEGEVDAATGRPTTSYTDIFANGTSPTIVATFDTPGTKTLTLDLFVPYEMDNDDVAVLHANGDGEVHWRIYIEDDSASASSNAAGSGGSGGTSTADGTGSSGSSGGGLFGKLPQTGTDLVLWILSLGSLGAAFVVVGVIVRRRTRE